MRNPINDTLCNIRQELKNKPIVSLCTVGNSPNKGVKITSCNGDEGLPLDKRWAKGGRKAICTISFVILQVVSGIKE
jgi:hypothetical protein